MMTVDVLTDEQARAWVREHCPPIVARAHDIDLLVRKDGVDRRFEADWLKDLLRWAEVMP